MTKKLENGRKAAKAKSIAVRPSLDTISEERWNRIALEAETLDLLRTGRRTCKAAAMAGTILGWSTSKVYRKLKAYEAAGHALALADERPKRVWHSKLSPEQDDILETSLTRFTSLQNYRGQPISEFVKLVFARCDDAGIPRPSESSVRRRWQRLSERERYAHKHGRRAAADKYDRNLGSTPPCTFPLERVQLDHTPGDIWVLSDDRSVALGRPTVTLVIDEFSRLVIGIHVTFGDPSTEELAEAMAIACLPKDGWLASFGITGIDWPWFGLPASIYVDSGVDFTSSAFYRGCQKWRIQLSHRQQAHHGGIIESLIGTAMGLTKTLPGNTRFSKAKRREDRIEPAKTAKLTLAEYLEKLVRFFVLEYPYEIHEALGMTPAEKWNEGIYDIGDPCRVEEPQEFYLDFLKAHMRKLEKYGVKISYLNYTDRKLQPLLNTSKSKRVLVKRDPADVSRAFVDDPRGNGHIEVVNELTADKGISVAEWEKARADLRKKLKGKKVTATGILGFLEKARKEASRRKTKPQRTSRIERRRLRSEAKREHKKTRSQVRLGARAAAPAPVAVADPAAIAPVELTLYATAGDVQ